MKKLVLGAALAVSSLTFAQQFGAKAGLNVSSVSGDTWSDAKAKPGFYAGVFYNQPISANFNIQPELIYTQYGAKDKLKNVPIYGDITTSVNLGYLAVPVMFQYNVVPSFYLEAGPEFGFMVNANSKTKYSNSDISNPDRKELKTSDFNTFNMGIGLGLGYNFTPNVGINARYVAGLNDVSKNDAWGSDAKDKNGTFQVGLNYKF